MAETWLPQEPPPTPPPRSAARRTLFLWLGLIAFFLIVYSALGDSASSGHGAARTHDEGALPWWLWPLCAGCLALPTALFVWRFGTSRRFNTLQVPAYEALGDGDHARAAQLFGDLARQFRAKPNVWVVASYNQAYALIHAGDAAAAVGILVGVDRWPGVALDGVRRLAAIQLARAFAIGGDLDKAQRWLDAARSRPSAGDPGQEYAQLADVEGLVLCRAGRLEDALRHYDQTWDRLQSRLTVRNMRAVWLLRAFAATSVSSPRHAAAAETWLRLLRATNPGSLAWLTAHWPELETFVATHELGVAPPRAVATEAGATARA